MVIPARTLGPNEIADLSVARLVQDHEWLAVAAYAKAGPDQLVGTLAHLAGACDRSDAFAWFWGLISRPDTPSAEAGWAAFETLPTSVEVPDELSDAVIAFVSAPAGPTTSRDSAAGALLLRLPGKLAQRASRAVLDAFQDAEAPPAPQAVDQAIAVLSPQRARADRDRVLRALQTRPVSERLPLLLSMSTPLRPEEVQTLQAALEESLAPVNPALVPQMQSAWHLLTLDGQRSIFANQVATASDRCKTFLTPGLLEPLGADQVLDFLSSGEATSKLTPTVAVAVVEDLATTGEPFGLEVLENAYSRLDEAALRAASLRLLQTVQRWDPSRRTVGLAAIMRPAIRDTDVPIGDALLQGVLPEDFASVIATVRLRTVEQGRYFGTWLSRYLGQGSTRTGQTTAESATERSASVADAIRSLSRRWREVVTSAIAERDGGELPAAVADVLLSELSLATIGARAGRGNTLLDALRRDDSVDLPAGDRCAVMLTIAANDPADAVAEAAVLAVEDDAALYDRELGPGQLAERILEALGSRPELLNRHVLRQLGTLDRPQGEAVPPERLAPVLTQALNSGLIEAIPDPAEHIRRLISGHKLLHPLAAKWLAEAPPTAELVEICVRADKHYARRSPYPTARLAQARTLASWVADMGLDTDVRVTALVSATNADPGIGRVAALRVPGDYPVRLRRAAARVLADSPGASDDVDRLTTLAEAEDDAEALGLLQSAIRRIHSGNVGEALGHLLALVDSDLDPARVSVSVVLPEPRLHDAFIAKVDTARGSLSGPPAMAVNSLVDLGEVLAEWAIGFTFCMSAKTAEDGRRLLENAPTKPKIGDLVRRQQLLQDLPWLASYAALRDDRSMHVAPAGTTVPVTVVDENVVTARHLARRVVSGWVETMYAVRDGST